MFNIHVRRLIRPLAVVLFMLGVSIAGSSVLTPAAYAQSVQGFAVEGNQRISDETVISYVQLRRGGSYDAFLVDESVKSLFSTGLFSDVKISRRGGTVVISVEENPVVNRVAFEGNKKVKDEQLVAEIQLQPRSVYSQSKAQSDLARILAVYRSIGRFGASVEPKIVRLPDNRVNVVFEINESAKSKISNISFVGNQAYSDRTLLNVVDTRESGILSFISRRDVYDSNKLESDQEALRRFYLERGYADFRIVSAVSDFDQNRNAFFITFTVEEGQRYNIGEVNIRSNVSAIDPEMLYSKLETKTGNVYNAKKVDKSLEAITFELAAKGYAFAQVRPRGDRNFDTQTIDLTYVIDEGARVYIEEINIRGNTRTLDTVIRREFDFAEGDAYNAVLINLAKRRLESLDFFESVSLNREPGSAADRVILVVDVVEKSTGSFSFGAGYQQDAGAIGDVTLTEKNFLGRGQEVKIALRKGQDLAEYEFSFTEPFFLGRRIAAGFDVFRNSLDRSDDSGYESVTTGGKIRLGFQLSDNLRLDTRAFYDKREVTLSTSGFISPVVAFSDLDRSAGGVGYTLTYSDLDNNRNPRNGYFAQLSQDIGGVGSDNSFLRTEVQGVVVKEFAEKYVGFLNVKAGHMTGLGNGDPQIFDSFFKGSNLVRGFADRGIGPRYNDGTNDDAIGGLMYVGATAEVRFPLPFIPEDFGLTGAVFADAGTLLDVGDISGLTAAQRANVFEDDAIRSSVGLGLIWVSPFGPIRADYGFVTSEGKYDEKQAFRFGSASRF